MKAKFFIAIIGLTFLFSWTSKQASTINKARWLIGTWENKTSRGTIYETWNKTSDKAFTGKSYFLKEKDTVIIENIQLVQEGEVLFYVPTVKNQNGGLPVRFTAKSISDTQMVFENLQHDFPQIISYTKISADSLVAEISGKKNGRERKQSFAMKRIK